MWICLRLLWPRVRENQLLWENACGVRVWTQVPAVLAARRALALVQHRESPLYTSVYKCANWQDVSVCCIHTELYREDNNSLFSAWVTCQQLAGLGYSQTKQWINFSFSIQGRGREAAVDKITDCCGIILRKVLEGKQKHHLPLYHSHLSHREKPTAAGCSAAQRGEVLLQVHTRTYCKPVLTATRICVLLCATSMYW